MTASEQPTAMVLHQLTPFLQRTALREAITRHTRLPETELIPGLLQQATLTDAQASRAQALAVRVARGVRERALDSGRAGLVQGLLQEFALSSQEGVALMCLAEALLRIPDADTRDALIRDKIGRGHWQQHLGQSPSLFVNAATWGLLLTGRLVATHSDTGLSSALRRLLGRGGEPLVRKGVDMAMRMMGEQFVTGQTIEEALGNAREREADGFRFSYDMLGEAALTAQDAQHYLKAYEDAINAIGRASAGRGIYEGPGISIKLSALHPRYARAQQQRVMDELLPRLLGLARLARQHDIGLNIDAEESERLELSLDLLEALCHDPALAGWNGIGFVIQAYAKRCPAVVDFLVDLARRTKRRLMVRLVKGAYWDSEIKRAQLDGLVDYPVYTRKAYTDLSYIACARKLLAAPDAIYPQFATHNAHTLAAVHTLAGENFYAGQYEFQCLHGMGEPLYEQVVGAVSNQKLGRPCRIYAPVGSHDTLLAYLVRRLLENGANSSFVNRIADESLPLEQLVEDPVQTVHAMSAAEGTLGASHPALPLPRQLFGGSRVNAQGLDLASEPTLLALQQASKDSFSRPWRAAPAPAAAELQTGAFTSTLHNPADPSDTVGQVQDATPQQVQAALTAAAESAKVWALTPVPIRAQMLETAALKLEQDMAPLCALLAREAGKTFANAVSEVREAVDFLNYYAQQIRRDFDNITHRPLGPVVCISPWNFPLAIFTGQVAAALAAGNTVLAKPAEQTPLVAAAAVQALHAAGVPTGALHLLPGPGETVGAALVASPLVQGVLFTGSTEVARLLQRALSTRLTTAGQPVPLLAETGGQNAMVVDTSALAEQVVQDVLTSAFDSAGQRCSALRVLCVQEECADRVLDMLLGAMADQRLGNPLELATDVGPVIDAQAQATINAHVQTLQSQGCRVWQPQAAAAKALPGCFVAPTVIEIQQLAQLQREVFGPVLHLLRYPRDDLPALLSQINDTGYGLTCGVHTRIDETVVQVAHAVHAGNLYVNRNVVGAVVGVQPFGGEGLSGTGPKAGGPLYLLRLLSQSPPQAAHDAVLAAGPEATAPVRGLSLHAVDPEAAAAAESLSAWAHAQDLHDLVLTCANARAQSPVVPWRSLVGPTGEANLYGVLPRQAVLCLAPEGAPGDLARLHALAAVLAMGSTAVWPAHARALAERLPVEVGFHITLAQDWQAPAVPIDAVVFAGADAELLGTLAAIAQRPGPLLGVTRLPLEGGAVALARLVMERSISVNTAAAGGNASLMAIG